MPVHLSKVLGVAGSSSTKAGTVSAPLLIAGAGKWQQADCLTSGSSRPPGWGGGGSALGEAADQRFPAVETSANT